MAQDQWLILGIIALSVLMFLWGKWRHDMVALAALMACVFLGLVPSEHAFAGFGHPAVITVACVLVLSHSLQVSGAVDLLAQRILPSSSTSKLMTIASLSGFAALLSAFMNNVGALALLMPIALQMAARQNMPAGMLLMPLAFGSILGGMTTLIGTPPNLIVSGFRRELNGTGFAMFDFTPVGLAVAIVGLLFIVLIGYRLVPRRERAGAEGFETSAYITEARVPEKSRIIDASLAEVEDMLDEDEAQIIGLIRNDMRISVPSRYRKIRAGDILVLEAEPEALASVLSSLDLKLEEEIDEKDIKAKAKREKEESEAELVAEDVASISEPPEEEEKEKRKAEKKPAQPEEIVLMELAVQPESTLVGRSATDIRLRSRYNINLLAVSRQGLRSISRLRSMLIKPGDVLLMQGAPEAIMEFSNQFGSVPLAERALRIPKKRIAFMAMAIMAMAVIGAAFGLLPAAISFAFGVLAVMVFKVVSPRNIYSAIDWPVIVLLAALIPVAGAIGETGAAALLADFLVNGIAQGQPIVALALILIVTMTLSDFMNNAATAAVMCPIAIGTAGQLGANPDAFLMAVAVGASCAFLTPIGHQNNTLILGPGGFRFGDYWRLGLPLEIIVVAVAVPMLLIVWPL